MHFSNFSKFRPKNKLLEAKTIFPRSSLPKGMFWAKIKKKWFFCECPSILDLLRKLFLRTYPNRSCFFCGSRQQHSCDICPASGQTCNYCHKTGLFTIVCQQAAKDQRASRPASHEPTPPDPRRAHIRLVEQEERSYILPEEGIQYENCFTLSNGQPLNTSVPTTAPPSDRGHFVLLL